MTVNPLTPLTCSKQNDWTGVIHAVTVGCMYIITAQVLQVLPVFCIPEHTLTVDEYIFRQADSTCVNSVTHLVDT